MAASLKQLILKTGQLFCAMVLLFTVIFSGCSKKNVSYTKPIFEDFYSKSINDHTAEITQANGLPEISISADNLPVKSILKLIMEKSDISVICDEGIEEKTVSLTVNNIRSDKVMQLVARRLNVSIYRDNNIYYIGQSKPEDKSVFITKCARLETANIKSAIEIMLTEAGKCLALNDGLVIVSDKTEILGRVASFIEDIKKAPADTWVVQYQIVTYSDNYQKELGLSASANFALAAGMAESTGDITSELNKAVTSGQASIISQPLQLIEDGTTGTLKDGTSTPIPQKTVSSEGTVTITGVDYIESGLEISTYIRDMGNGHARVKVVISSTTVSGYIDNYPITKGQKTTFQTAIKSGQPYLIANLTQNSESTSKNTAIASSLNIFKKLAGIGSKTSTGISKSSSDKSEKSLTQIWARAYKIGGMLK